MNIHNEAYNSSFFVPYFRYALLADLRLDPDCIWLVDYLLATRHRPPKMSHILASANPAGETRRRLSPSRLRRMVRQLTECGYLEVKTIMVRPKFPQKQWRLYLPSDPRMSADDLLGLDTVIDIGTPTHSKAA